jgi:heat-inducible transcriptional repressor
MLDDRKTSILRAVVQEYITTAQPVGSTHIADLPACGSVRRPVRNEMAVLEQEGYLAQPHTSAGRVPTTRVTGSSSTT